MADRSDEVVCPPRAPDERRRGPASAGEWGRQGLPRPLRRIAQAAAEGFLSDRDGSDGLAPPDAARCRSVVDDFSRTIGAASLPVRWGIGGLLLAVEVLPVAVVRRLRRMSRLPLADRVRYLKALEEHDRGLLATLLVGLKIPMTLSAFERGEGLRMTGFDRASVSATRAGRGGGGAAGDRPDDPDGPAAPTEGAS